MTASSRRTGSAAVLTIAAPRPTEISFTAGMRVTNVRSDRGEPIPFVADGASVTLTAPAGTSILEIS